MPSRIIKESIRTSDTLADVSAEAERLFWRIVVSADDFGRFEARPGIILGQSLSAFVERGLTTDQVSKWLDELERFGLIIRYTVDGKEYLMLTKWDKHQQKRAKTSKFPQPPTLDNTCNQMHANVPVFENVNVSVNGSGSESGDNHSVKNMPLPQKDVYNLDDYCQEIEHQMVAVGANPNYTATDAAYRGVKQFYEAAVPIEFVKEVIVKVADREKSKGKSRIKSFAYCIDVVREEWAKELIKREPGQPLDLHMEVAATRQRDPAASGPYVPKGLPPEVLALLGDDDD